MQLAVRFFFPVEGRGGQQRRCRLPPLKGEVYGLPLSVEVKRRPVLGCVARAYPADGRWRMGWKGCAFGSETGRFYDRSGDGTDPIRLRTVGSPRNTGTRVIRCVEMWKQAESLGSLR